MTERTNRRELIIQTAARLFLANGYAETSVRQIAEAASMTEAALYYHFKDGKRELFQYAMEGIAPDFSHVVQACASARTLQDFVRQFGLAMMPILDISGVKMRWLAIQMQSAQPQEYAGVLNRMQDFHEALAESLQRFVPDSAGAQQVAWALIVTALGYGYLFGAMRMAEQSSFSAQDLLDLVLKLVENYE